MENIFIQLHLFYPHATESEKRIIEYVLENSSKVIKMTIRDLANSTFSSASTVSRLCKKVGYDGFLDFKNAIVYGDALRNFDDTSIQEDLSKDDSIKEIIQKTSMRNILALENSAKLLNEEDIDKSIKLIEEAQAINLFGMGASLLVAKDAGLKFIRINKFCSVYEDWHTQRILATNMKKNDLAIIFSYSGQTLEMIDIAKEVVKNGSEIILITGFPNSKLSMYADIILPVSSVEHLYRSGAMSSRISQMNVVDILYTAYVYKHYESSFEKIYRTHINKGLEE